MSLLTWSVGQVYTALDVCVCMCIRPSKPQLQCERLSQTSIARVCGRPPCVLPIQQTPPATTDCHQVINSAYNSFSSLTSWCQHVHVHVMSICLFSESSKLQGSLSCSPILMDWDKEGHLFTSKEKTLCTVCRQHRGNWCGLSGTV